MTLSLHQSNQSGKNKPEINNDDLSHLHPWIFLHGFDEVDGQQTQECFDRICESLQTLTGFTLAISEGSQLAIHERISKIKKHVQKLAVMYEMHIPLGFNRDGNAAPAKKEVV